MAKQIKMLTSVAGFVGKHDSPSFGAVLDVDDETAAAWADGERAVLIDEGKPPVKPTPDPKPKKKAPAKPKKEMGKKSPAPEKAVASPAAESR